MLKLLTALFGTLLKYSKIPTNINSRDFDIRKTIFGITFGVLFTGLIYTVDRLYICTIESAKNEGHHDTIDQENTDLKKTIRRLKNKLHKHKKSIKICKTISCAINANYEE